MPTIVWDLDETLCHTFFGGEGMEQASNKKSSRFYKFKPTKDNSDETWGTLRKHARKVLLTLHEYGFTQIVWSAGEYEYVHSIVDIIFKPLDFRPRMILTREDCETIYNKRSHRITSIKNLQKLWNLHEYNQYNTIIVDNRSDVCSYNANNHILIPDYEPKHDNPFIEDDHLLSIMNHLLRNKRIRDVRWITDVSF
jgi:hypothetical protein